VVSRERCRWPGKGVQLDHRPQVVAPAAVEAWRGRNRPLRGLGELRQLPGEHPHGIEVVRLNSALLSATMSGTSSWSPGHRRWSHRRRLQARQGRIPALCASLQGDSYGRIHWPLNQLAGLNLDGWEVNVDRCYLVGMDRRRSEFHVSLLFSSCFSLMATRCSSEFVSGSPLYKGTDKD
jgi:hypothetical protein